MTRVVDVVATVEELAALDVGTVLLNAHLQALQKETDLDRATTWWEFPGSSRRWAVSPPPEGEEPGDVLRVLGAPLAVLWVPSPPVDEDLS